MLDLLINKANRTGLILLGNIFLTPAFNKLRSPASKHLFSIIASAFSFWCLFDPLGWFQLFVHAIFTFYLTKILAPLKWGPAAVLALLMLSLGTNHFYLQIILKWKDSEMNYTTAMMVLVMKLSSFAFAVGDGHRKKNDQQEQNAIYDYPNFTEYMGFVFFFPSAIVGPTFSFRKYIQFIKKEEEFKDIPKTFIPSLKCFFEAIATGYIVLALDRQMNHQSLLTQDFSALSFSSKMTRIMIAGIIARCKYYCAWKLSETSCVATGFGFNGEGKWDRLENVDILKVEFAPNPRAVFENWNKNTANWLKYDVYIRLIESLKMPVSYAGFITALLSAFWHGLYPKYYVTFLSGSLTTHCARLVRKHVRPLFLKKKKYTYDWVGILATQIIVSYIACPFKLRSFSEIHHIYSQVYYSGHIALIATIVILNNRSVTGRLKFLTESFHDEAAQKEVKAKHESLKLKGLENRMKVEEKRAQRKVIKEI